MKKIDPRKRFEEKYYITPGCWIWIAALGSSGYGHFWFNGNPTPAHRASYQIYVGEIKDNLQVLHRCDNRLCVNPDHFFLGTHKDNMDDRTNKGRDKKGNELSISKLTNEKVLAIRNDKRSLRKMASELGVSHTTVFHARNHILWKHVK